MMNKPVKQLQQSKKTIKGFFSKLFERIPELYGIMIVDEQDDLWSKALSPNFTSSIKKSDLFNQLLDYTGKPMTEEEKEEEIKNFLADDKSFDFHMSLVLTFNLSASKMKKLPNFKKEFVPQPMMKKKETSELERKPMNLLTAPPMALGNASSSTFPQDDDKTPQNFIITFLKDFILVQFQINLKDDPQQKGSNQPQQNNNLGPAGMNNRSGPAGKSKKSKKGGKSRKGKKGKHEDGNDDFDDDEDGGDDDGEDEKDEDDSEGNANGEVNGEESLFVTYIGGKDLNVQQLITLSTPISAMLVSS